MMSNILFTHFIIFLFIFVRIISAFSLAPVFNSKSIPILAKLSISLVTAYVIFSFIETDNIQIEVSIWFITTNVIKEIITGVLLGFSINLVFYAISFAGTLIGFDIGLGMANVFNPTEEINNNVLGEYLYILAVFVLLIINGHHYIIRALTFSFTIVPLGHYTINQSVYDFLINTGAAVFVLAVKIASPILVSFFLVHLAEGIMARVIPQMQVFFVTYPLKIGLGIGLLTISIPLYLYMIKNLLSSYENKLYQLVQLMR